MSSRLVLIGGFGGLLALMAFAELDGVRALRQTQKANDDIREDFLHRDRLLERIRGDVYVSGTYVRDYLLEPEPGKAEGHRYSLRETRADMDQAIAEYRRLLRSPEVAPFGVLTQTLNSYWKVLEPVFDWPTDQRRRSGYIFLRDEVFPRRQAMLGIADQIRAINEAQVDQGRLRVEQTFGEFESRSLITLAVTVGLGLLLAAFSVRKILSLESGAAVHLRELTAARGELSELSARLVKRRKRNAAPSRASCTMRWASRSPASWSKWRISRR